MRSLRHRAGDFERLLAVLDPEVVLRSDGGAARPRLTLMVRGAQAVAGRAMTFRALVETSTRILVNGVPGIVWAPDGSLAAVVAFTVRGGRIFGLDFLTDPERLRQLDLAALAG